MLPGVDVIRPQEQEQEQEQQQDKGIRWPGVFVLGPAAGLAVRF